MNISATAGAEIEPHSPIADRSIASSSVGTATNGDVTRRLTNAKVRAIFECLHHQTPPPPNLPFTIVPVGAHGKDLSPPSFEFEYGLYVLLRPAKLNKRKNVPLVVPQAPSHLQHLVMTEFPPETCKWQLSGPQFPQPTAIQQRYCYPRGRKEYSQCTGSALWTMYNSDDVENKEYRLLHVYYSSKRLFNGSFRGNDVSLNHEDDVESHLSQPKATPYPRRPPKRRKSTSDTVRPYMQSDQTSRMIVMPRSIHYPHDHGRGSLPSSPLGLDHHSIMDTTTTFGSFDHPSSHGYVVSPPNSWPDMSIITTEQHNAGWAQQYRRPQAPYQRFYPPLAFHQSTHDMYSSDDSVDESTLRDDTHQDVLPFRQRDLDHFDIHDQHPPILQSPSFGLHPSADLTITIPRLGDDVNDDDLGSIPSSVDSFSWDEDMPTEWTTDNDPFCGISFSFSRDHGLETNTAIFTQDSHQISRLDHLDTDPPLMDEEFCFASSLHRVHERLRDHIYSAPTDEQPELIHAFATWARRLAQDPLGAAMENTKLPVVLEDAAHPSNDDDDSSSQSDAADTDTLSDVEAV